MLGCVLDGHGILIRSKWDLAGYVKSGRLRIVLRQYTRPSADLLIYYLNRKNRTASTPAFIDLLVEHFQTYPALAFKL